MTTPKTSYTVWIDGEQKRKEAVSIVSRAALPFALTCKRDKRTGKQNSRQWAMLGEVSQNILWHGQTLSADDWKLIFMAALFKENRIVPNLNNDGFVNLARSSSSLTVAEHSDLTALIEAFAGERGYTFKDPASIENATEERKSE